MHCFGFFGSGSTLFAKLFFVHPSFGAESDTSCFLFLRLMGPVLPILPGSPGLPGLPCPPCGVTSGGATTHSFSVCCIAAQTAFGNLFVTPCFVAIMCIGEIFHKGAGLIKLPQNGRPKERGNTVARVAPVFCGVISPSFPFDSPFVFPHKLFGSCYDGTRPLHGHFIL